MVIPLAMKTLSRTIGWMLAALLVAAVPLSSEAKGYSSGGHSYSSSGSHSSSSSGGHSSYSSGGSSGSKSYSSGSTWSGGGSRSYSSGKSYSSGVDHLFTSHSGGNGAGGGSGASGAAATPARKSDAGSSRFTYDSAAARAHKEETSRQDYSRFRDNQRSSSGTPDATMPRNSASSYQGQPPPIIRNYGGGSYRAPVYVPSANIIVTRPYRVQTFYAPYYSRPVIVYHDPYSSLFWWWLLDRSLDDRAYWAYHHRYDMDPMRYQSLLATDQQLEARVAQLEAQQAPRDPQFVPTGLDRDLMYSDNYVHRAYNTRPTAGGQVAFWVLGVPTALAFTGFFIWLIWFKRWQTAT